jgi:hypothetical protein
LPNKINSNAVAFIANAYADYPDGNDDGEHRLDRVALT